MAEKVAERGAERGRRSLKLRVGRQDFTVSCEAGEEALMRAAAARVAREMGEARTRFRAADGERAATMAALRVAFEAERAAAGTAAGTGETAAGTDGGVGGAKKKLSETEILGVGRGKIGLLSERIRAVLARTGSPQERDGT